ncbi:TRAP transporter substrate-binding protein [Bacillus sp. B15-48]|uniref:TRAP transporter substrate-binding protein n=1 Tax=Bacillus sp. B15-48 TaxID=1548601 RepID=UPI00193FB5AD|nr:TRAP transporter substrate-binding protein [Bacillus sp. B15-48]MBM4763667.1 hypothetical protein [Bacillus sp. B15-48]
MKRVKLFLSIVFILFLAACGNSNQSSEPSSTEEKNDTDSQETANDESYVLKMSHGFPTGAFHHTFMEWFADEVETKSDGRLKIEIYPTGQLMPPDQEVPAMLQGQIDMSHSSSPVLAGFDPIWNFYELPFLFESDSDDPSVYLEEKIKFNQAENGGQQIVRLMEEKGLKVISLNFVDMFGSVFTTSTDNMITTPESANGLKLRTPGGLIGPETVKAIGASGMTIAGSEVITALQQGVVDGLLTTPLYAHDAQLPIKSFSAVPVFNSVTPVVMSLSKFDSLPEDLQEVLLQAGRDLEIYAKEQVGEKAKTVFSNLENQGVEIFYPTEDEMAQWEEATQPAKELFMNEVEGGKELLETLSSLN